MLQNKTLFFHKHLATSGTSASLITSTVSVIVSASDPHAENSPIDITDNNINIKRKFFIRVSFENITCSPPQSTRVS